MIRALFALSAASLLIAACTPTQTVYGPAGPGSRALGYDSLRIEEDRWRVSFTAGPDASPADTERYALRRAAELTVQNGFDWFEIIDRRADESGRNGSPVRVGGSLGTTIGSGGYRGSGVGIGIGISPGQERRSTVSLEFIAGRGENPPERAYDARSLLGNLTGY